MTTKHLRYALRECFEEIAVPNDAIEIIGLDDVVSIFGTIVSPMIGRSERAGTPCGRQPRIARVFSVNGMILHIVGATAKRPGVNVNTRCISGS